MRNSCIILVGKPKRIAHLGDMDLDWKVILECVLKKQDVRCGLLSSGSGYIAVPASKKRGKETWGFIKGGKFIACNYHVLKKDSVLWS